MSYNKIYIGFFDEKLRFLRDNMTEKIDNKIEAKHKSVSEVLDGQKYSVDYFQREYSWTDKHIEELITDLTSSFLSEYSVGDLREQGGKYNNYYLGPFVVSNKDGKKSIIDGQQRLTSLTLFIIYLNHLQKDLECDEKIDSMIFSELRGSKSFNITVPERESCFKGLFEAGTYSVKNDDDESTKNMERRYGEIDRAFPEQLKNKEILPFFIDWLRFNVILVEITAYSDENAYTIFETMNDRGLNLTSVEMLKGLLLSRFSENNRKKADEEWKKAILELKSFEDNDESRFFQAWLRGQYADTIRQGKSGAKNEDFEKIGTRFHSWVRDNPDKIFLDKNIDYENFFNIDFKFFHRAYIKILKAERQLSHGLESVYYINQWGIAPALSHPLMLAALTTVDSDILVNKKIELVARYIESFVVRRSVNFKHFSANSIRYTMYSLVKEIRGRDIESLKVILSEKLENMSEDFDGIKNFRLHGQNKRFVKFLLARLTSWVELQSGMDVNFKTYYFPEKGKPFEIEHILADKFDRHRDEFETEWDFQEFRNRIGGLLLLPQGANQSYGGLVYEQKQPHYIKENLLAKSLCKMTYKNNPNFINFFQKYNLPFKAHTSFKKNDMEERQYLYQKLCEAIWTNEME